MVKPHVNTHSLTEIGTKIEKVAVLHIFQQTEESKVL